MVKELQLLSNQHAGTLAVDGSNGTGGQQPIGQLRMYFCGSIGRISQEKSAATGVTNGPDNSGSLELDVVTVWVTGSGSPLHVLLDWSF